MNKKRCVFCKKYKLAESMISSNIGNFCDNNCRYEYGTKKTGELLKKSKLLKDKAFLVKKRNFKLSDLKLRKRAAVTACHNYIKARDFGKRCITCDRVMIGKYDSGHFIKATHSYTKFMEKNIHSQCVNCNQYNGGREREYKEVLILKYGKFTVKALEKLRSVNIKRTAQDYLAIEKHYKDKIKLL